MKISIVTISFNQAEFLERALKSVLDQGYPHLEYIVVDPGSKDGSREIIDSYGEKTAVRVYEKDDGAADGLNRGFSRATGEIYGFLNSDDELLPGALQRVADFFGSHPDIDVVTGCGYFTDRHGARLRRIVPSKLTPWLYVHGGVSVFQQGTFFRSGCFHRAGGFNPTNRTCWDGELFLDMAVAGAKFQTISDDLACFRLHEGGITGSGRLAVQYRRDVKRLFEKVKGRSRNRFDSVQDVAAKVVKFVVNPVYPFRRVASTLDVRP
jgi:glycosyltransferase involved in cell wall biosynthesis